MTWHSRLPWQRKLLRDLRNRKKSLRKSIGLMSGLKPKDGFSERRLVNAYEEGKMFLNAIDKKIECVKNGRDW